MVIYKRNRNGTKRKAGSTINPFDMVIATLPDLSSMISKTYISEIDFSKIDTGQLVNIRVDAFADKSFTGKVISIAQIGERLTNSDTKVFEVMCRVDTYDPVLRPSMTTNNKIIIKSFDNVIYVPLESVQTDAEGFSYVITRSKTKQVVMLGESNDKFIIIDKGLEPGTEIYISPPADSWKFKISEESLVTEADLSQKYLKLDNLSGKTGLNN
jgi:multidrug efflux pump subunit AcrA (membrane-fusion protein)